MFLGYRNIVLLRGSCGWSKNNQVKPFHLSKSETSNQTMSGISWRSALIQKNIHRNPWPDNVRAHRTMSGLTGHFRTYLRKPHFFRELSPDNVRSYQTISGIWIWAQWLVSWESSINTPPPTTAQKAWTLYFPVKQAHILYSKSSISLSPRAFIPSSYLGIEWSKDLSSLCDSPPQARLGCWIFILHACYS
jgi:hypothetical protein